jgi:hypothetical protein
MVRFAFGINHEKGAGIGEQRRNNASDAFPGSGGGNGEKMSLTVEVDGLPPSNTYGFFHAKTDTLPWRRELPPPEQQTVILYGAYWLLRTKMTGPRR